MPATQAQFDALLADATFRAQWNRAWRINTAPVIPDISAQRIAEDGTLTLTSTITDDFTPAAGITVTAEAVRVDDHSVVDTSLVNAPTISAPDANGRRTLSVTALPNASGQVAIKVRAVDAGGKAAERVFVLTVDAVADAPVVTVAKAQAPAAPLTVNSFEAGPIALTIEAALTDKDGSETLEVRVAGLPAQITLSAGTLRSDGVWSLTPAQLTGLALIGPKAWDAQLDLTVTAVSREASSGLTATSAPVAVAVPINARPTDIVMPPQTGSGFLETQAIGSDLRQFTVVDPDGVDSYTFELLEDAGGRFAMTSSGMLRVGPKGLDFEAASSPVIKVRVTDHGGLTIVKEFTIRIADANEAPTGIAAGALAITENAATGTVVGRFTSTDQDAGDTASYALAEDASGRFKIDTDGTLRATGSGLDFEKADKHTVRVRVTDKAGLTREEDFTVTVSNVNEAPTDLLTSDKLEVFEDVAVGTLVGTFTRKDEDAGDGATYSLADDATGRFTIDAGGRLTTKTALSDGNYTVRVRVKDTAGLVYEESFTVTVLNRNAKPTDLYFESPISVAENVNDQTRVLGRVLAKDPDAGDKLSFSILNPNGTPLDAGGRFRIDSDGNVSRGTTTLDYETATSYTFTVQVIDSGGLSYTEDMTISVTDVNDLAPVFGRSSYSYSVAENGAGGVLGTVSATDGDATAAFRNLRYEVEGTDKSFFTINATTGELSVAGGLNYEARTSYSVSVRAWDGGAIGSGNSTAVGVTLGVTNVDELPTVTAPSATVNEGSFGGPGGLLTDTAGNYVRVTGSDPEGTKLSYQVIGGNGEFSVDSDGYVHVQNVVLDYEARTSYGFTVRAWDGGSIGAGNAVDRTVSITVANVNEGPRVSQYIAGSRFTGYFEGQAVYFPVYGFRFSDPEGDAITSVTVKFAGPDLFGNFAESDAFVAKLGDFGGTTGVEHAYLESLDLPANAVIPYNFDTLVVTAQDVHGARSTTRVQPFTGAVLPPVVLDLDGDGIELVSLSQSSVSFDMNGDGLRDRTGWVGADDALLVLDRNHDGVIGEGCEISFIGDLPGANSDLEGLAAFDTNHNNAFDAGDARFGEFQLWQDKNQDGVSQAEELRALADRGITAIDLTRGLTGHTSVGATDNVITAVAAFQRADGTVGQVGDVELLFNASRLEILDDVGAQEDQIDEIDRRAHDDIARRTQDDIDLRARPGSDSPLFDVAEPPPVQPERASAFEQGSEEPRDDAEDRGTLQSELQSALAARASVDDDDAEQWQGDNPVRSHGALHANLSVTARQRLQMIEALAAFEPETAANLSLMPGRNVDGRTLALLTSTSIQPQRAALW
jgi:Cadherin domain